MSRLRIALAVGVGGSALIATVLCGGWFALSRKAGAVRAQLWDVHAGDFPIPAQLTEAERAELPLDIALSQDLDAIARDRASLRGKHLVEAVYGCVECHGRDFGGGSMIDDPLIGQVSGPNLTLGEGGTTRDYAARDWDRKVRHGVGPDGRSGLMPSVDYQRMSDRELGDIVSYIRSLPPVDREVPPIELGPLGTALVALGELRLSAATLEQTAQHPALPPPEGPTVEYGQHLAGVCTGCHRANLEGGPIPGAPPDWLPAANLTPHEQGLQGWTYDGFARTMRSGIRPDGTPVGLPMSMIVPYSANLTEVEMQALWAYLRTVAPAPDGAR